MTKIIKRDKFDIRWESNSSDTTKWQTNRTTEGLVNQQANREDYLTTVFTPPLTGLYELQGQVTFSNNSTNDNVLLDLEITGGSVNLTRDFSHIEVSDSSGLGEVLNVLQNGVITFNVNTGTDIRHSASVITLVELQQGVEYTLKTKWAAQSTDDETAIYFGTQLVKYFKS